MTLDGSASSDVDIPFGDSLVSYEWDLDGDGVYDLSGSSPTVVLSATTLGSMGVGLHEVTLRVTDEVGAVDTDSSYLRILAGPPSTITLNAGPTSGAIPISVFNTSLGWAQSVELQVTLQGGGTNSGPSHVHSVGYLPCGGGTTFASPGGHAHSVSLPSFSGGGLTIPGFSFSTSGASNSGHSISPYSTTTNPGGTSPHSFSSQVRSYNFSGGGTAPFLGGSNFSIPTGSTGTTEDDGVHFHGDSRNGSNTGSGGGHSHTYSRAWSSSTQYSYVPNSPPSADAGGPYEVVDGQGLTLSAGNSFDVDQVFGDSIVTYEWDLDNNGIYEVSSSSPSYSVPTLILNAFGAGDHTINVRVTDELGASQIASTIITRMNNSPDITGTDVSAALTETDATLSATGQLNVVDPQSS